MNGVVGSVALSDLIREMRVSKEDGSIWNWLDKKIYEEGYTTGFAFGGYGCTWEFVGVGDRGHVFKVSDGSAVIAVKVSVIDPVFDYKLDLNDGYALTTIHERLADATFVPLLFDHGLSHTVVEFVDGITLSETIDSGKMDFESFMYVYEEIENALTVLLRDGIMALDVTAYNVVMVADGSWKIVDVGEFEIYDDMEHVESWYGDEAWEIIQEQMDGLREHFGNA